MRSEGLGRASKGWRLALALTIVVIVFVAQFSRANDWFPLGTLGQYAYPRDPNGAVLNTYVTGVNTEGDELRVGLTAASAGITRAEFEVRLADFLADPTLLADVVATWERTHPPHELVSITVRQTVHRLSDGALDGEPEEKIILTWVVP